MNVNTLVRKLRRAPSFAWGQLRKRLRWRRLPHFKRALKIHLDACRTHPMVALFWKYAMTSVDRGEMAVRILRQYRAVSGARFLDVGTAYGGFPIAFAEAGASEALGIESDPQLIALAHELLKDCPCSARIIKGDAMDSEFMRSLGDFDIITCNDVIEHVDDAWKLVRHLSFCLRPDGILWLEMPNSRSQGQVVKDGHYGLFGISLLPRAEAAAYHHQKFPQEYAVGEYYSLDQYLRAFEHEGLRVVCTDSPKANEEAIASLLDKMKVLEANYKDRVRNAGVDETTQRHLLDAFASYFADFKKSYRSYQEASGLPDSKFKARELFLNYQTEFWHLLGRKDGSGPSYGTSTTPDGANLA
jgi:2-polyprenyl-3-methyl-5-hydroxy-6-metoxy-1,4-benzoquinol methylase